MADTANQDVAARASHLLGRCLLCLVFPIVCAWNFMFAMQFLQKNLEMDDIVIIFVCGVFCLHILFNCCCCPEEPVDDVSEEDVSKESVGIANVGKQYVRLDREISRSVVIEMGF